MKFAPVTAADLQFDAKGMAVTAHYADVYHSRSGAIAQAQAVFLEGTGLPGRWRARDQFVILETGLGLAHNFLATWLAWRNDPERCSRLHYVGIDCAPVRLADLRRAHGALDLGPMQALAEELHTHWPIATPDVHRLVFDDGRVILDCVWAEVVPALRELRLQADAVYLDGFSPRRNPKMWEPAVFEALGHRLQPDASAATWSASRHVREGLERLRFHVERLPGFGGKRHRIQARRRPAHPKAESAALRAAHVPHPGRTPGTPWRSGDPPVLIVGGGIAGAACALALHRRGIPCRVIDAAAQPAEGASGNPAGLVHAVVHRDDGAHARLLRAAALFAARTYRPALAAGWMTGSLDGLVRRAPVAEDGSPSVHTLQAQRERTGLPAELVDVVDVGQATGLPFLHGEAGWLFPDGGWIDPGAWVRSVLALRGVEWTGSTPVAALQRDAEGWSLQHSDGSEIARGPWLILAAAAGLSALLPERLHQHWAWGWQRGQITKVSGTEALGPLPRIPISGGGYGLMLPQALGALALVCGATTQRQEADTTLRAQDHAINLERWSRMAGPAAVAHRRQSPTEWDVVGLTGRAATRFLTEDRLPLVGPLPDWNASQRSTGSHAGQSWGPQAAVRLRDIPMAPGLLCCSGLGGRGLTLAPLMGEAVASQLAGDPLPLPAALIEAIDPRRLELALALGQARARQTAS